MLRHPNYAKKCIVSCDFYEYFFNYFSMLKELIGVHKILSQRISKAQFPF